MTITTMASREFNQHASEAKKAAQPGCVFLTDRGPSAHGVTENRRIAPSHRVAGDHRGPARGLAGYRGHAIGYTNHESSGP